jgi:hypothetical protein
MEIRKAGDRLRERLLRHVETNVVSECWMWTAKRCSDGYGLLRINGRTWKAHRLSHMMFVGAIASGLAVCHRCDTPACINPAHLFAATQLENIADRTRKGRSARHIGEKNGRAKLTMDQVRFIRSSAATAASIARELGVTKTLVCNIRKGLLWKHSMGEQ